MSAELERGVSEAERQRVVPAIEERFGPYGGRYVPEVLIPALDELSAAWAEARVDPGFRGELDSLLSGFVGRPTPLYHAERLSDRVGRRVYLKREDLAHTGAHKINNAVGQALLARRMGKGRVIAAKGLGFGTRQRPERGLVRVVVEARTKGRAPIATGHRVDGGARHGDFQHSPRLYV